MSEISRAGAGRLRNVGIVAHVDHGKTTLVDHLLRQSGALARKEAIDRVMDSMDQERERGITILAKAAALEWEGHRITLVDTPGHADFGGEVERALNLVDGVLLLVDAAEGPLPQTRFVLQKSLKKNLPVVLVINKVDRQDARPEEVLDEVYALFIDLDAADSEIEFPVIYAIARDGKAARSLEELKTATDLKALYETLIETLPPPEVGSEDDPPQLLVSNLDHDDYLGRLAIGRLHAGRLRTNQRVTVCQDEGQTINGTIATLGVYSGMARRTVEQVSAGEIVLVSGIEEVTVGDTICEAEKVRALPRLTVDPPTLSMVFRVNDGPYAGKDGRYLTNRHLQARLEKEDRRNVAIQIEKLPEMEGFKVSGRGELQLAVLVESMRREGYELTVSAPTPVLHKENGQILEPYEILFFDLPTQAVGGISTILGERKGRMLAMEDAGSGRTKMEWRIPTRALVGLGPRFLTETKGEGIFHTIFDTWDEWAGPLVRRSSGALVSDRQGVSVPYGLFSLEDRGVFFIGSGVPVYDGMVVGEHNRNNDLNVNVCRTKKLTNIRAAGKDDAVLLTPPRQMSLERALEWIRDDELVEVTPKVIRIRKRALDAVTRHREVRDRKREAGELDR
ncbi:MAG: translational GTPase TypA [Deltaproteobacteria bacterium]|nr:translational GTPase TypA [Deltaproteobacteria bacterium]